MSIYEAIFNRCSVREYEMEKLAPGRLEALERYLIHPSHQAIKNILDRVVERRALVDYVMD